MADISYWDSSLNQELSSLSSQISSFSKSPTPQQLSQAQTALTRCSNIRKSFRMEIRLVKNGVERRSYEDKLKAHDARIAKLEGELKWAREGGGAKKELFGGARKGERDPEAEGDQMLADASKIQDKTQDSLAHTQKMVAASKEVATATIEELHRQREQIKDITEEVIQIEDNLERADKLIRTFGRRMATDKFIQCFACINVLLLTGVIIYAIVSKKGLGGDTNATPQSPVRMLFESMLGKEFE